VAKSIIPIFLQFSQQSLGFFQRKILPTYLVIVCACNSLIGILSALQWCHIVILAWLKTSKQSQSKLHHLS